MAFQISDDVLDVSGPVERTGKSRGTDLLDGTVTLPLILARERDSELAGVDLAALSRRTQQAEELCERIAATGALEQARERALALVAEAKAALPASLPGRSARRRWSGWPTRWSSATARGQRGLQEPTVLEKSDGTIRSASSARMKNSTSSSMFACVSCFRSLSSALVALVQLLVELLDDRLLEHALAPGLALGAAQHDSPVARAFLGPVQRICELAGAVEADVQRIGDADAGRSLDGAAAAGRDRRRRSACRWAAARDDGWGGFCRGAWSDHELIDFQAAAFSTLARG